MTEITVSEWAARRGVPPQRARRWARDGRIGARCVHGRWVVDAEEPVPVLRRGRPAKVAAVLVALLCLASSCSDVCTPSSEGMAALCAEIEGCSRDVGEACWREHAAEGTEAVESCIIERCAEQDASELQ